MKINLTYVFIIAIFFFFAGNFTAPITLSTHHHSVQNCYDLQSLMKPDITGEKSYSKETKTKYTALSQSEVPHLMINKLPIELHNNVFNADIDYNLTFDASTLDTSEFNLITFMGDDSSCKRNIYC